MKQYKIAKYFSLILVVMSAFAACQKQEALFGFKERVQPPPPPKPPPPPPPPPLSEEFKNVEFLYNDSLVKTSMIGRKRFSATRQPNGRYSNGFELLIRLDNNAEEAGFQQLQIVLPLSDSGHVKAGHYVIDSNEVKDGKLIDLVYTKGTFTNVFPDAAFSTGKAQFNFNISLRIEHFDPTGHTIAGVIDSLKIYSAADTSKKITIKNAGFNFYFDFLEFFINDTLMYETTTQTYDYWFPRLYSETEYFTGPSGEELYPVREGVPYSAAMLTVTALFNKDQTEFTLPMEFPVNPYSANQYQLRSMNYEEIDGRPVLGIVPASDFHCRFINATQVDVAGGAEISTTQGKILLDEFYDYNVTPVVYYPQKLLNSPVYKLKCAFYQRKI